MSSPTSTFTSSISTQLSSTFGSQILSNPSLLSELTSLSRTFTIDPQDLFYKWEAFSLNNLNQSADVSATNGDLNIDNLKLFRSTLQRESEREKKNGRISNGPASNIAASTPVKRENVGFGSAGTSARKQNTPSLGNLLGLNPSTPSSKPKPRTSINNNFATPSIPASASRSKLNGSYTNGSSSSSIGNVSTSGGGGAFSSGTTRMPLNETPTRPTNNSSSNSNSNGMDIDLPSPISQSTRNTPSGAILETLNPHLKPLSSSSSDEQGQGVGSGSNKSRVKLAVNKDPKTWNYRYMFEKEGSKSQVLDEKIDEMSEIIRVHYGIGMGLQDHQDEEEEEVVVVKGENGEVEKKKEKKRLGNGIGLGKSQYEHLELGDPSRASQQDMIVVGRICIDLNLSSSSTSSSSANKTNNNASSDTDIDLDLEMDLDSNQQEKDDEILDSTNQPLSSTLPHLSESNLVLESSRMLGAGTVIPLIFSPNCRLKTDPENNGEEFGLEKGTKSKTQLGLYPGMIVGLKGKNGGGNTFTVDEILLPPPLPHSATPKSELLELQHSKSKLDGKPMKFLSASGPYTDSDDLRFDPWHQLMDGFEKEGADVVLLLGPFLSKTHPLVASGELPNLPSEIFSKEIISRLNRLLTISPRTTIILIPSTLDLLMPHSAWPQPMLEKEQFGIPKKIKCLPNPCIFSINEIVIAASTADILRDFKKEEIVKMFRVGSGEVESKIKVIDPMDRFCRQVLGQRSLYPIYPPSEASNLSISTTHLHLSSFYPVSPDLLILPSSLKPFARIVDSTVCINPGPISKNSGSEPSSTSGDSVGSWARIGVECFDKEKLESKDEVEEMEDVNHDCWERTRVEIVRL